MSGLVHAMIGWIALRIAFGAGGDADQGGALRSFAQLPLGGVLLWVGGLVMIALALWLGLDAWFGARRERETSDRAVHAVKSLGKAVTYGVLAATALRFAAGGSSDSGEQSASVTSTLMGMPLGRMLVALLGLVVLAIGGYHVVKGATRRFVDDLERGSHHPAVGPAVVVTGVVGYVAKGLALASVGILFGWAALRANPEQATGLDGALKALAGMPVGTILLVLTGAGLILFGVYCVFRARYADM
ncbi:DUF1206 domain-containing protein [Brachybacterium sp. EF45031]|nr:DUF1206 domain-containing protein [Brachybacterium sillae]